MKRFRLGALALLTTALVTAGVAAASGTVAQKSFVFSAEWTGTQTLTWTVDGKPPYGGASCAAGDQSFIGPTRGSGRLSFTFSGRDGYVPGLVLRGGQVALGGGGDGPLHGTMEGKWRAYVKSEGYWDPSDRCDINATLGPPYDEDLIDPTDKCGSFSGRGHFGFDWRGGKLHVDGSAGSLNPPVDSECPLLKAWPSASESVLLDQLDPFVLAESSVPLSAREVQSGETISRTNTITMTSSPSDPWGLVHGEVVDTWTLTLIPRVKRLRAVPEASAALRGDVAKLDGSKSTGDIVSYVWTFKAADGCGDVSTRPGARKSGKQVTIKPLCPVAATLKVSDGHDSDSATVTVPVLPRTSDWTTPPVKHEEVLRDERVSDPPFIHPGSTYGITLGENVAACEPGSLGPPMLCPPARGGTGLGGRYTLAAVDDPGGPFDGYFYVASAPLTVERLGILNYWFLPGSPAFVANQPNFWDYNASHQVQVGGALQNVDLQGLRRAMSAHEGMGLPGQLATGHSGRLQAWLRDEEGDPRRALETKFGRSKATLQRVVDNELATISAALALATKDPLPVIWRGQVWFYDREDSVWRQDELTVGG
jgi:hypothetical protein